MTLFRPPEQSITETPLVSYNSSGWTTSYPYFGEAEINALHQISLTASPAQGVPDGQYMESWQPATVNPQPPITHSTSPWQQEVDGNDPQLLQLYRSRLTLAGGTAKSYNARNTNPTNAFEVANYTIPTNDIKAIDIITTDKVRLVKPSKSAKPVKISKPTISSPNTMKSNQSKDQSTADTTETANTINTITNDINSKICDIKNASDANESCVGSVRSTKSKDRSTADTTETANIINTNTIKINGRSCSVTDGNDAQKSSVDSAKSRILQDQNTSDTADTADTTNNDINDTNDTNGKICNFSNAIDANKSSVGPVKFTESKDQNAADIASISNTVSNDTSGKICNIRNSDDANKSSIGPASSTISNDQTTANTTDIADTSNTITNETNGKSCNVRNSNDDKKIIVGSINATNVNKGNDVNGINATNVNKNNAVNGINGINAPNADKRKVVNGINATNFNKRNVVNGINATNFNKTSVSNGIDANNINKSSVANGINATKVKKSKVFSSINARTSANCKKSTIANGGSKSRNNVVVFNNNQDTKIAGIKNNDIASGIATTKNKKNDGNAISLLQESAIIEADDPGLSSLSRNASIKTESASVQFVRRSSPARLQSPEPALQLAPARSFSPALDEQVSESDNTGIVLTMGKREIEEEYSAEIDPTLLIEPLLSIDISQSDPENEGEVTEDSWESWDPRGLCECKYRCLTPVQGIPSELCQSILVELTQECQKNIVSDGHEPSLPMSDI